MRIIARPIIHAIRIALAAQAICSLEAVGTAWAAESVAEVWSRPPAFDGAKSDWHGFDRYDFFMDEQTLAVRPADADVHGNVSGQRRCIVIAPKTALRCNPWSWRGCYWDHQPQTEIELLRRGFHIAYIAADASMRPTRDGTPGTHS